MKRNKPKYHGITYGKNAKANCKKGIHLFDEVFGVCNGITKDWDDYHYLVCDKCGLTVIIKEIATEKQMCERVKKKIYT